MGSVFLRGDTGSWVIQYKDPNGKLKTETVGKKPAVTKTMARKRLEDIERSIEDNKYEMSKAVIPTLNEFSKDYIDFQINIKQIRSHDRSKRVLDYFSKLYGDKKLSEITIQDIDIYKQQRLTEGIKPGTLKRELNVIRNMFYQAKRWRKFYDDNPVSLSGMPEVYDLKERILTFDEEQRLLNSSPSHFKNIVIAALNTGMRKGELISLKWSNVDLENNVITLESINTKSKKKRLIPINSVLRKLLLELKLKSPNNEYVFLSADGKRYKKHDSLNGIWKRTTKKAGIEGLRFHDLRHTAATRMVEAGVNIVAVNKILGHSDLKMTMRYSHPENSLVDAVETLAKTI